MGAPFNRSGLISFFSLEEGEEFRFQGSNKVHTKLGCYAYADETGKELWVPENQDPNVIRHLQPQDVYPITMSWNGCDQMIVNFDDPSVLCSIPDAVWDLIDLATLLDPLRSRWVEMGFCPAVEISPSLGMNAHTYWT